jgi:uncharacterized Zn-finger protein
MESSQTFIQELPRRKQQVTQERSKVLRETERDPFADDEDEEEEEPQQSSSAIPPKPQASPPRDTTARTSYAPFPSAAKPPKKPKKDKKGGKKKSRVFNLEEEKPKMKTVIAESSLASTNLLNALQRINREQEQVSENAAAAKEFDYSKMLRRHVLRYVSASLNLKFRNRLMIIKHRFSTSNLNSGLAP